MVHRLQEIVGKLYKPPADGSRQVFALSRGDAEKVPRLPSIAVISVTAPERPPASLDGFAYLLRLSFEDVDFLSPNLSKKLRGKLIHAFTAEQAQAIHSFVEALPMEIVSVVVHCEGGYSRSCAIALALHRLYGYQAEIERLSQANPSVVRVMTDRGRNWTSDKQLKAVRYGSAQPETVVTPKPVPPPYSGSGCSIQSQPCTPDSSRQRKTPSREGRPSAGRSG
ncbi:hypothetical protein Y023_325 [Burkholderia pseudomallei A79D]|nr:hypothetical protein X995_1189 [Burkholderia pseudomallei B03]AIV96734.1 hypothetical protein X996_1140 [Burkholderia pseudomallei A79A]KGY05531.1 hypothetical protein Y023_325 [Burkholderia pseudomallei A79D]KGY06573.1 hypothetical protein X997_320 [Burkholderia pseudomallei A79C]